MITSDLLYLPGDPEFEETLGIELPPTIGGQEWVYIARAGSGGLLEAVHPEAVTEYVYGGEYDERMSEIEEVDEFCF